MTADPCTWRASICFCLRIGAMNLHAKEPHPSAISGQAQPLSHSMGEGGRKAG